MHPSPVARLFDEQPHHPEADRSPTLAARYYVDPEIFEAEKEAIFYRSWQFAAHRWQLAAPHRKAGDVIRALAWLGPEEVEDGLEAVLPTLRDEDRDELSAARATMPSWMAQPVSARLSHG